MLVCLPQSWLAFLRSALDEQVSFFISAVDQAENPVASSIVSCLDHNFANHSNDLCFSEVVRDFALAAPDFIRILSSEKVFSVCSRSSPPSKSLKSQFGQFTEQANVSIFSCWHNAIHVKDSTSAHLHILCHVGAAVVVVVTFLLLWCQRTHSRTKQQSLIDLRKHQIPLQPFWCWCALSYSLESLLAKMYGGTESMRTAGR